MSQTDFVNPHYLVETDWLEDHLSDPTLRILECTVYLLPDEKTGGHRIENGRADWAAGHIPGSGFADLVHELSDSEAQFDFTMPPVEQVAEVMSRCGVGERTRVVLYDRAGTMWATRVWWMLRACGFDNAAVLNGGWHKWHQEGRPISVDPPSYPPAQFIPQPRPNLWADKAEVLTAIRSGSTCLLNTLGQNNYQAKRIPNSFNLHARELLDPNTQAYLSPDQLYQAFADVKATSSERVITYCGGGISASSNAFVLTLLGINNVAVYDGSMSEWAADPALPVETG